MTPEVFQQISSGVQSIAVALAMVVGGTWGVYEFLVRRADRKADKDAEVEMRRAEINGELEASSEPGFEPGTWLVKVRHTLENGGDRAVTIQWAAAPLRVALLEPTKLADSGGVTWKPVGSTERHSITGLDAQSSGTAVNPRAVYLAPGLR
jgi:hypothetical protein